MWPRAVRAATTRLNRRAVVPLRAGATRRRPQTVPSDAAAAPVDLVTVTFNRPDLLAEQHRRLLRFYSDDHTWTVADNSSDPVARRAIADYCARHAVPYLGLRPSYFTGRDGSRSHGDALNDVWRHYLADRASEVVGFLDHDMLPLRPFAIADRLGPTGLFGRHWDSVAGWLLWPGYAFYRRSVLPPRPDWSPVTGTDTGGAMIPLLYAGIDRSALQPCPDQRVPVGDDHYDLIDACLHVANASHWRNDRATDKDRVVAAVLAELTEA